ncbi:MAG TPA: aryl-sulfate sulfotransferase, partial [Polyangiaceae bacterium]
MKYPDLRSRLHPTWPVLAAAGMVSLGCGSGSSGGTPTATVSTGSVSNGGSASATTATRTTGAGAPVTASGGGASVTASGGGASVTASGGGAAGAGPGGATGAVEGDGYEVKVDPYGNCPLAAVVNLEGIEPDEVQRLWVVVAGRDGAPDFEREYSPTGGDFADQLDTSDLTFSKPGTHVPVLGLYADIENSVRIRVELLDGDHVELTLNLETRLSNPDEDAWVPAIRVDTTTAELMEPGWTVAELSIEPDPAPPIVFVDWTRTIAFDERGAVRWVLRPELPKGETFTLTRSLTGNFLTGSFDTVVEMNKLGRTLRSFQLPDHSLNHEILQIGSDDAAHASPGASSQHLGNLLVLASKNDAPTIQDHILELDGDTGAVLEDWDLATVFDTTRTTYVDPERWSPGAGDWLHTNGLAYSNPDESIIVSGRHQGVAKIRRDGTLVWLLAPHAGWQEPQSQKLLTAVDATLTPYAEPVQLGNEAAGDPSTPEFGWAFGQHSPALMPNGDLLLFDNGSSRHFGAV